MDCPHCDSALEKRRTGTVTLEECPSCNGMWLSDEDLRRAKDETDPDLNWMDFDLWTHRDHFEVGGEPVTCPSCGEDMVAIQYGETRVQVDYCTSCRGVWLDGGEFEKIIRALQSELESKDCPDYLRASLREAGDLIRSDEGLMSDWRDLRTVMRMLKYRIFSRSTGIVSILADLQARNPIQ